MQFSNPWWSRRNFNTLKHLDFSISMKIKIIIFKHILKIMQFLAVLILLSTWTVFWTLLGGRTAPRNRDSQQKCFNRQTVTFSMVRSSWKSACKHRKSFNMGVRGAVASFCEAVNDRLFFSQPWDTQEHEIVLSSKHRDRRYPEKCL